MIYDFRRSMNSPSPQRVSVSGLSRTTVNFQKIHNVRIDALNNAASLAGDTAATAFANRDCEVMLTTIRDFHDARHSPSPIGSEGFLTTIHNLDGAHDSSPQSLPSRGL
jgi:hypothetical protein